MLWMCSPERRRKGNDIHTGKQELTDSINAVMPCQPQIGSSAFCGPMYSTPIFLSVLVALAVVRNETSLARSGASTRFWTMSLGIRLFPHG